jgi:hypothetical protein
MTAVVAWVLCDGSLLASLFFDNPQPVLMDDIGVEPCDVGANLASAILMDEPREATANLDVDMPNYTQTALSMQCSRFLRTNLEDSTSMYTHTLDLWRLCCYQQRKMDMSKNPRPAMPSAFPTKPAVLGCCNPWLERPLSKTDPKQLPQPIHCLR